MKAYEILGKRIQQRGITIAELSRRVGMDSELLRRSLNGDRKINADEFVSLCIELGLSISDFTTKALNKEALCQLTSRSASSS